MQYVCYEISNKIFAAIKNFRLIQDTAVIMMYKQVDTGSPA